MSTAPTMVAVTPHGAPPAGFSPRDHGVSGESRVTSIVGGTTCPALSFMMSEMKVSVTGDTVYERGACSDIVVGVKLRVSGTMSSDARSVAATNVEIEGAEDEPGENEPVEGEGIITGLRSGTSCPALTFLIGSKAIGVTRDTVFDRGACEDLTVGRRVQVKGAMTGDEVVAVRISVQTDSPGHPVVEGDGRVTSLVSSTSCPALSFTIEEWTVTLDGSTIFVAGACADVAVGKKLGVMGTVTAEHAVLAQRIVFKADDDNRD